MTKNPVLKTPRELYRAALREMLDGKAQTIASGPLEGERVVLLADVTWATGEPFPPVSDHGAEVSTPARVVVYAYCPRCAQPGALSVELGAELRVDATSSSLHLKAKSKAVSHSCGQMPLNGILDGQTSFELEDIIGDDSDALKVGDVARIVGDAPTIIDVEHYLVTGFGSDEPDGPTNLVELVDLKNPDAGVVVSTDNVAKLTPDELDALPERCPYPFCGLSFEHVGDHVILKRAGGQPADTAEPFDPPTDE